MQPGSAQGEGTNGGVADAADRALLAAAATGDAEAYSRLVQAHRDRLWAVALRTLGDREEAADALQDALLSAYRRAGQYRGEARVTTWLHRIVVNACLDRARRAAARPTVTLPASGTGEPADPHDRLATRETHIELEGALMALPVDQRAAVVLVDVQGLPFEEAARVLEVPVGTVKSRCFRGRARLAARLGHLRNSPVPGTVPPGRDHSGAEVSGTEGLLGRGPQPEGGTS